MKNMIPIADRQALSSHGVNVSNKTLSKWFRERRAPGILVKVFGRVYIDLNAWEKYIDALARQQMSVDELLNA